MDRLDVPGIPWRRVSPKLTWVELVTEIVFGGLLTAACLLLGLVALAGTTSGAVWTVIGAIVGVITLLVAVFTPRRIRAIGFALRDDDLVVRRGLLFQRFVAVPYGRLQLVDVARTPLNRVLGLSELRFVTAAAASNVRLPGLPAAVADDLRDRLVELAESRRVGL
ncbi:PH domain-containing protein [Curtobacterium ammoniigenes]|uniref:PH domain-containing protein n=1 Tax=Curtobacterium ammoniigenes TaxID=395387 RepID=UPI000832AE9B|nr:PH domain-containing protein [Curtobacterium ammoniigenes]